MTINYQKIYKKAALNGGWSVKNKSDVTTRWGDFYEYVKKFLSGKEAALDLGTAEGNNFMRLAPFIKKGVGVDLEPEMIRLAKKNKKTAGIKNINFEVMDVRHLSFPRNYFDIVISKHAPVDFKEAIKILKPGGKLITQQVHETDKSNIKRAFGRGQNYRVSAGNLLRKYMRRGKAAGFINIKSRVSNMPHFFSSAEKLLNFLSKTPTIPDFGARKTDHGILEKFIKKNQTPKGIRSNTARFILEITKPVKKKKSGL